MAKNSLDRLLRLNLQRNEFPKEGSEEVEDEEVHVVVVEEEVTAEVVGMTVGVVVEVVGEEEEEQEEEGTKARWKLGLVTGTAHRVVI